MSDPPPSQIKLEVVREGEAEQDQWVLVLDVPVIPELSRRKPVVALNLEPHYPLPHYLTLKLRSLEPVSFIEASTESGHGMRFLAASGATSADGATARWHNLASGSMARWPVNIERAHSDEISLAIKSLGPNQERWDLQERL